ncbi:hypothetical protein CHLNCDRAFT_139686 [Chlorella variabilis]|uniref:Wbp11/ELF5/Saf1 N-terminal domain-containing protein n=1 Tax=Chlorella variabilis TaxID=554065 RepID=E1ZQP8_CHLVA|nr:hypothetical protein CHLNCDRAFT_139686 [Chlorella variabilis]EFN51835.1 hypothetical protein CHLNCDRAFT_139686 [Chlorella variabilis]|eukprot:XP_005843937.1 hypothetical protein CHLNCDRAFT_139686 [Chlorella variabilis]
MVKKKAGREINPADAHRKAERAKEIARNKKERQLQRAALKQRLKKKALQQAYDLAIKRKMEEEAAARMGGRGLEEIAAEPVGRPEDSELSHMPPLSGSYEADQQLRKVGQGAVISGKSTVVPLPKAHEDKRGFGLVPRMLQPQRPAAPAAGAAPASVDDRVKDFLASLAGL